MQNTDEIFVGLAGQVYAAPVGATAPTDLAAAWDAAWIDLGFTTEDGVTLTDSKTLSEKRGWPSPHVLRRWVQTRDFMAAFTLVQFNAENLIRALGGGLVEEPSTGVFSYSPPDDDDLGQFALGIEAVDGSRIYRFIIPSGVVDEAVEIPINRQDSTELPVSFKAQVPSAGSIYTMLTNDAAFDPGS